MNFIISRKFVKISLIIFVFAFFVQNCFGGIIDTLDNTLYLNAVLNASVTANGNSTVSMTITGSGDSVVNWYDCCYVRLRNSNDRVEIQPTGAIGAGQYSLWILFFDSSKQFLAEIQWASTGGGTDLQVLPSVAQLAAGNNISNVEYYWLRFRLDGNIGEGFIFDEIRTENGPGYWPPTALTTSAPKAVFAHEMTGFRTLEHSGYWQGWNSYSHNPLVVDANGKPEIASVYYPSVGYYDMSDSNLVEYHCQSLKMAEIDGVIFDLGFYDMDTATVSMISNYLNIMAGYGLQAVICYEDKAHWIWDAGATTRAIAVQRAYDDMNNWLALFNASGIQYNVTGTRPLFLLFSYEQSTPIGTSCLSPAEITAWRNTFSAENKPVMMRQWFKNPDHVGVLNGQFSWPVLYTAPPEMAPYVGYCDMNDNNDTLYNQRDFGQYLFENSLADFHMPGVWPGFDDIEIWGWGGGPRLMPRYDGQLYEVTWDWAIDDNLPVVQIATWNDWFEGTIIEPAVEFGNLYLEKTFENATEFKNLPNSPVPDFNVPIWIYKLRDTTSDSQVLSDMNTASALIASGQFQQAEQLVSPWANYFAIDSVTYWAGSGSIATEPNIQVASNLSFTTIPVGTSDVNSIIITNTGTDVLVFTGATPISIISGQPDFSLDGAVYTGDLPINQTRSIAIKFEPQNEGTKTGVLRITTNDPDSPTVDVNLIGDASRAGDYYPDGKIDMKDFAVLSNRWQDIYFSSDLKSLTDNWLQ